MIAGNVGDPPYAIDSNGDGGALIRRGDRFTGVRVGNEAAVRRRVNYRADGLQRRRERERTRGRRASAELEEGERRKREEETVERVKRCLPRSDSRK